jgi:hypothetical protein
MTHVTSTVLAIAVFSSPLLAQNPQQPKPACGLITIAEVSKYSGGPVEVDAKASGEDTDSASSGCVWKVKGSNAPPVVILTIENGDLPGSAERLLGKPPAGGRVPASFSARKVEAFSGPPPSAVPGLGDEAFYRDFERVKGGALLVRRGIWFVSFSGSMSKDGYIALARLVLQRM